MASVKEFLKSLVSSKKAEEKPKVVLTNGYQYIYYLLFKIVIWDNILNSLLAMLFVSFMFWVLASLTYRMYGLICLVLLVITAQEAMQLLVDKIWAFLFPVPEERMIYVLDQPNLMSFEELDETVARYKSYFAAFLREIFHVRETQKLKFLLMSSMYFVLLFGIGNFIADIRLLYAACMTILTVPGVYIRLLPESFKQNIKEGLESVYHVIQQGFANYEAEVVPENVLPEEETMRQLTAAYDFLINEGDDAESIVTIPEGLMPSHEEVDALQRSTEARPSSPFVGLGVTYKNREKSSTMSTVGEDATANIRNIWRNIVNSVGNGDESQKIQEEQQRDDQNPVLNIEDDFEIINDGDIQTDDDDDLLSDD